MSLVSFHTGQYVSVPPTHTPPKAQHKRFNDLLNDLLSPTSHAPPRATASPITYSHKRLIDSFYGSEGPGGPGKIRVTRDEKTGTVVECVRKMRLGDLNVYSPKSAADWRITVSLEIPGPSFLAP